jgi:hypothetical protein
LSNFFLNNLWPGLTVWSLLYVSDYALTLKCARLYRSGVSEKFVFEGSYEITPFFQRDIDSLKSISPRFLGMLLWGAVLLTAVWLLAKQLVPQLYYFALGSMILIQLAIHTRHLRSLFLFRSIINTDQVRGRIEYSRHLLLQMSATELFTFSGLFLLLFVFTQDWFVFGGAASCLSTAMKHRRLMHRLASNAVSSAQPQQGT